MSRKSPLTRRVEIGRRRKRRFTAIDLFSGCGGLTSGLKAAGFEVVAAIEKDADAAASYKANHPNVKLYEKDIREVSPRELLRDVTLMGGRSVDLIAGCPPCQGFTRLTESNGRRELRNSLVREFLRFVNAIRPKVCMLENVPGLVTTKKGRRYFNELTDGLQTAGYRVSYDIFEMADYGVPQRRRRLVVLAARGRAARGRGVCFPTPTHRNPAYKEKSGLRPWKTVRDTIGKLPKPPLRSSIKLGRATAQYKWHFARDVARDVQRRLEHALQNSGDRMGLPTSLRLACHNRHPNGFYDVYGVMDWDAPAPTITSGCTNASKGRFGHPRDPRPLTAIEAAALQTFPLSYKLSGSGVESVATQIGNALPRRFAKILGKAIIKQLSYAL